MKKLRLLTIESASQSQGNYLITLLVSARHWGLNSTHPPNIPIFLQISATYEHQNFALFDSGSVWPFGLAISTVLY